MNNSVNASSRVRADHTGIMRRVVRHAEPREPAPEPLTASQAPVMGDLVDVVERVFGLRFETATSQSGNTIWRLAWSANYSLNGLDHTSATVKEDAALHFLTFHGVTMGDILDPDQAVVRAIRNGARIFEDINKVHRISDEVNHLNFHGTTRFSVARSYNEATTARLYETRVGVSSRVIFDQVAKQTIKKCGNCRWYEKSKCNWPVELLPVAYRGAFNGFSAKVYDTDGENCLEFEEVPF